MVNYSLPSYICLSQKVDIKAADDKYETNTKQTFEQKGLTIAITSLIIDAFQAVQSAVKSTKKVGQSKNDRINAMAAANSAMSAYHAGQSAMKVREAIQDAMGKGGVDSVRACRKLIPNGKPQQRVR
ncbi:hypothetical protein [Rodentibacter caecimuris]|uniref:hypothetical protein n=1 Tax=Rodentibacter caecimuris TaxID=1796644 RepID=UPI000985C23F|nr:hypothetical protein BKG97_10180 [Rodentibacter heylii]